MQKLSTADAIAAAVKLSEKRRNFEKLTFYTYNIRKTKYFLLESKFLISKF